MIHGIRARFLVRWAVVAMCLVFVAANVAACRHAGAMMTFSPTGARTQSPERLGALGKLRVLLAGVNLPRPQNRSSPADRGLPFEVHRYPNGRGETLEAWYVPQGGGRPLVMLFPAYGSSKDSLLDLASEFTSFDVRTFLVDFYGSGGSSGSGTTLGAREAADVKASLDYVRAHWPDAPVVLHGSSMGGAAVLRAIARHGAEPDAVIVEAVFDSMLNTVGNRFKAMGLPSTPFAQLLVFWGGRQAGFDGFDHNPAEDAASVNVPTLVLHGEIDPRVTVEEARSLYTALAGWKRYSQYAGAGHESLSKANPPQWRRDVSELLDLVKSMP